MTETFHAGPNLGRLSDVTIVHGDCIEREADYLPMIQRRIARCLNS